MSTSLPKGFPSAEEIGAILFEARSGHRLAAYKALRLAVFLCPHLAGVESVEITASKEDIEFARRAVAHAAWVEKQ